LAGLDTELGSILQESLGSTAAKWGTWFSFQALLSGLLCLSRYLLWIVAEGTDATVLWECGLSSVIPGDFIYLLSFSCFYGSLLS